MRLSEAVGGLEHKLEAFPSKPGVFAFIYVINRRA